MIVVRIDRVKGDVSIPGYTDWFIAESFGFNVGAKVSTKESKNDLEKEESDDQELTISKKTDSATVYLMYAAMKGRSPKGMQPCSIDIHVLENRMVGDTDKAKKAIKAYLKIRIENAIIQTWGISGSDTERPSEDISIWFNRAAMKYTTTHDGRSSVVHGPLGWDQYANDDWKPDSLLRE